MNKDELLKQVVNVMETGTKNGKYDYVNVMKDGKGGTAQITYGRSCTTEQGGLKLLLSSYINDNGKYANEMKKYLPNVGVYPMWDNRNFLSLLKIAGKDPIMQSTQDRYFDKQYYQPAMEWCNNRHFQYWLSRLVVYDSYIHSGRILDFLVKKILTSPSMNEKKWVHEYLNVRNQWLSNHSNKLLRNSSYRTRDYLEMINNENWTLDKPFQANGVNFRN